MQIKITGVSRSALWYQKYIGEVFEVYHVDEDGVYWTREPEGYLNIVYSADAEIVDEEE